MYALYNLINKYLIEILVNKYRYLFVLNTNNDLEIVKKCLTLINVKNKKNERTFKVFNLIYFYCFLKLFNFLYNCCKFISETFGKLLKEVSNYTSNSISEIFNLKKKNLIGFIHLLYYHKLATRE